MSAGAPGGVVEKVTEGFAKLAPGIGPAGGVAVTPGSTAAVGQETESVIGTAMTAVAVS